MSEDRRPSGAEQAVRDLTDYGLRGEVAVVSGGGCPAAGIGNGAATALLLARCGARVAVVDIDREAAARTVALIEEEGAGAAVAFVGDVGDEAFADELAAEVGASLGPPAVLVNLVGVVAAPGSVLDLDLAGWEATMAVNVRSVFLMSRWCLRAMIERGSGSIVNVGSGAGLIGGYPDAAYATSKGAVAQMTRAMAANHGPDGVRVNCVAPGMVYAPAVAPRLTPEAREARRLSSSLKTEGTPWDVAAAILFFAGSMSRWVTGVVMPVDAGATSAIQISYGFGDEGTGLAEPS